MLPNNQDPMLQQRLAQMIQPPANQLRQRPQMPVAPGGAAPWGTPAPMPQAPMGQQPMPPQPQPMGLSSFQQVQSQLPPQAAAAPTMRVGPQMPPGPQRY